MRLTPFKLEEFFEEFEFQPDMIALGSSDAQALTVGDVLKMHSGVLDLNQIPLAYQDVKGDESLRNAVAEMYDTSFVTAQNVLITTGASEAIFLALHGLLAQGDKALVCRPVFQSIVEVARMAGADLSFYDYVERDNFRPDVNCVGESIRSSSPPKLVFVNTPHNPTGRAIDEPTLTSLLNEAQENGITMLINEIYSGIWLSPTRPVPSAITLNPNAVIIAGLSKVFGLAGLRTGWIVGPAEVIELCKGLRYYTTLCPPAILQRLGEIAVRNSGRILERTRQTVLRNYKTAVDWLMAHEHLFSWVQPDAGQVMLIRLKKNIDTELFAKELARRVSVLLIPCTTCFGMEQGYLRLGLGGEPARFSEGLDRLSRFCASELIS